MELAPLGEGREVNVFIPEVCAWYTAAAVYALIWLVVGVRYARAEYRAGLAVGAPPGVEGHVACTLMGGLVGVCWPLLLVGKCLGVLFVGIHPPEKTK